jgi:hypothetical protein
MNWPQDLAVAALCLTLSGATAATAEDQPRTFVIQFQVLVLATGVPFTAETHRADSGDELAWVGAIDTMRVGEVELDLDSDLMWNGQAEPPAGSGIELLTAPQVVIAEGTTGVVRSGSAIQYLERRDEGCYSVQTLPPDASPGVVLTVVPKTGPDQEDGTKTVDLDFSVRIATIGDRQPVAGLDLDVGRPTINAKEVKSRYNYPLGRWNLLTSHFSRDPAKPDGERLLVLVRAKRRPA